MENHTTIQAFSKIVIILLIILNASSTKSQEQCLDPEELFFFGPETGLFSSDLQDYSEAKTITSFCNCGTSGTINSVEFGDCTEPPCAIFLEKDVELNYNYVSNLHFPKLDFKLFLRDPNNTSEEILVRHVNGTGIINPDNPISSYIRLSFANVKLKCQTDWDMYIVRSYAGTEICARIPVQFFSQDSDDFSFECTAEGYFPDTCDCSKYHFCQLLSNGSYWDSTMDCVPSTVWCPELEQCEYPHTCPCTL